MSETTAKLKERIYSIDFLRGIVMMLMLLDHTRDFVQSGALASDPTDPATTNLALFFTRWITHYCAPTFVFLSGMSIYLQKLNGKSNAELSRFLWTRGLWLILIEFTVVRFSLVFNFDYSFFGLAQVIWVIGVSMIAMAALIYFPVRLVGLLGLAMIVFHNLLDGFRVAPETAFGGTPPPSFSQAIWIILHQPGMIPVTDGTSVMVAYPLIPWIGVMAAGYALGTIYARDAVWRRKILLYAGAGAALLFIAVRAMNVYGDPVPWVAQPRPGFTFLSFLNTTKYPPSLLFLLMTLGPSLIVLALADRIDGKAIWQRIAIGFGRVPMFFYLLQMFVAHGAAVVLSFLAGKDIAYLFKSFPENAALAPPDHGFPLWVAYLTWIGGMIILYPLCVWWGGLKRRNKHWVFSYL